MSWRYRFALILSATMFSCLDSAKVTTTGEGDVPGNDEKSDTPTPTPTVDAASGGAPDLPNCGSQNFAVTTTQIGANVMLVLDRSDSMTQKVGTETKWDALKASVHTLFAAQTSAIDWGLALFPRESAPSCTPGLVNVPIGPGNSSTILGNLDPMMSVSSQSGGNATTLGLGTPTGPTLKAVSDNGKLDDLTRENVVILMTDGQPGCTDNPVQLVTNIISGLYARTPSVRTFVIGLGSGTSSSPGALNAWANAGHTALTGTTQYYQANDVTQLTSALSAIVGSLASCTYMLDTAPSDPSLLTAYLNGTSVTMNSADGFSYNAGMQSIVFSGASCAQIQSDATSQVQILYGCSGGTIN